MAHSGAAAGGELEEKVDLSKEVEASLVRSKELVAGNQLAEALALLAGLEKKCRVGNDTPSLVKVCVASLEHCKHDQEALLSTLETLSTRRSQKTAAVAAMVQLCMPWVMENDYEPLQFKGDKEKLEYRDKLVVALRDITDGKLFLETERAYLTRCLAIIKENSGDIAGAANVLQEVHVETYGSLSKAKKIEFILEQMRLTLEKQDYVRAAIVAAKVSRKHLAEENMESLKVRFFTLMTIYHRHEQNAFELAKDYHAIYSTACVKDDESDKALFSCVLFLALAPHDNEQQDMMHRLSSDPNLEKLPDAHALMEKLLLQEIMAYPIVPHQETLIKDLDEYWIETLHRRVIQHNIRIVSKYYTKIQATRLATLLQLSTEKVEEEISNLVSNGDGSVYAKINRPANEIRFSPPKTPEEVLSDWASDIDKLLGLVETTTHLIQKENMTN